MSSPTRPSTKQTLLPDSDIHNLIVKDSPYQRSYDNLIQNEGLNDHSTYLENSNYQALNRLPTLYEILNRRTQAPVDLWSFYIYIRDYQGAVDYLDFWIDVVTHLRLCKDYVRGLRESLLLSEKHKSSSDDRYKTSSDEKKQLSSGGNDNFEQFSPPHQARESVSSSLLLEALLNEGFLDDKDNKRVSSFLQGNEYVNIPDSRLSSIFNTTPDLLQQEKEEYPEQQQHYYTQDPYEPLSSPKKIFAADLHRRSSSMQLDASGNSPNARNSTRVLPEQLEQYIANVKNGNITRTTLKSSSKNLLNTYFQENSPKKLVIPDRIIRKIRHDVEIQGRDDPEVFEDAKNYVYSAMERESLPFFLQQNALHNVTSKSSLYRLISGFFLLFAGLWISYSLIFVDVKPKAIRAVIIVPFLIGSYLLLSFLFRLDPLMVFLGYSDNQELVSPYKNQKSKTWIKNIKEPFVKDLLRRRAFWVLFLILLLSAVLSIVFGLVPGHRI